VIDPIFLIFGFLGLEIVDTIAAKILEEDTYRFLRKMQEEYAVNSEESVDLDENASKVQEVLDKNFELLCALQIQQYQRANTSPNDTEVTLGMDHILYLLNRIRILNHLSQHPSSLRT